MRKWIALGAVLLGSASQAEPRWALIAAGRCQDLDLIQIASSLESWLKSKLGDELAGAPELTQRFSEAPTRSGDQLREQIEAARIQYYQADYSSAERELRQAFDEIDLLEPGPTQWNLRLAGELLRAMVLSAASRSADAEDSLRRVLQLAPDHALDPDLYPPQTRKRFERIRRQVADSAKVLLTVRSAPSGASLFLDGLEMIGKTPLSLELVPGRYTLRLSKEEAISRPRRLQLTQPAALDVDLDLEASFRSSPFPCIAEGHPRESLSRAARLGSWIGLKEVIVLRLERSVDGSRSLLATVVQVPTAEKVREGSMEIGRGHEREGLAGLGEYLLSGKLSHHVRLINGSGLMAETAVARDERTPQAFRLEPPPIEDAMRPLQWMYGWRTSLGSAAVGLGLLGLGAGAVFQARSAKAWSDFYSYYSNGRIPSSDDLPRLHAMRRRAQEERNAATLAFAAGGFAIATGSMFFLADRGSAEPSLTIAPLPGAILISGTLR
jgi:hypothetical protein